MRPILASPAPPVLRKWPFFPHFLAHGLDLLGPDAELMAWRRPSLGLASSASHRRDRSLSAGKAPGVTPFRPLFQFLIVRMGENTSDRTINGRPPVAGVHLGPPAEHGCPGLDASGRRVGMCEMSGRCCQNVARTWGSSTFGNGTSRPPGCTVDVRSPRRRIEIPSSSMRCRLAS